MVMLKHFDVSMLEAYATLDFLVNLKKISILL